MTNESKSRSSSNAYKGDRFIPFRGTQDNFFEEFIINNEIQKESKKSKNNLVPNTENNNQTNQTDNIGNLNANSSAYSSNSSNNSNGVQYSKGSGHKKQQSF